MFKNTGRESKGLNNRLRLNEMTLPWIELATRPDIVKMFALFTIAFDSNMPKVKTAEVNKFRS